MTETELNEFNDTENSLDMNVATKKLKKYTNEISEMAELNTDLMRLIKDEENLIKENMRIISNLEVGMLVAHFAVSIILIIHSKANLKFS